MALTKGHGPFGERAQGRFNFERRGPDRVLYFDPCPKRVRVELGGVTVADSRRTHLLHETGLLPVYYFPVEDVRPDVVGPSDRRTWCPFKGEAQHWSLCVGQRAAEDAMWGYDAPLDSASFLAGHRAFYFDAVDAWYEEHERIHGHPRDPYHRIDTRRAERHVLVSMQEHVLAESHRPTILFESSLPPRYYLPPEDVRLDLLGASHTRTTCAYKGFATYRSACASDTAVQDAAWLYEDPWLDGTPIRGMLCFDPKKVRVEVDGEPLAPQ